MCAYTLTAADEHGGIVGSAITEDTSEETAGETIDEHDNEAFEAEESVIDCHWASVWSGADDSVESALA